MFHSPLGFLKLVDESDDEISKSTQEIHWGENRAQQEIPEGIQAMFPQAALSP